MRSFAVYNITLCISRLEKEFEVCQIAFTWYSYKTITSFHKTTTFHGQVGSGGYSNYFFDGCEAPGGGHDLERGYGDVWPWRPPFHASPAARNGPISSKRVSSQDPLLRKFWNFSLNSLNFHPNCSSQAPKFGNFQLTSPQIWKFSAHKPPFSEANVSSQAPHFGNLGRTPLPEKKLSAPPPPGVKPEVWNPYTYLRVFLMLIISSILKKRFKHKLSKISGILWNTVSTAKIKIKGWLITLLLRR